MRFGILSLLVLGLSGIAGPSARANLVTNGNFATGDFTGWVSPVDPSIVIDSSFAPPADTYDAAFTGSGTLSQNIVTVAGQAYTLSFSLLDEAGFILDNFSVGFGAFSASFTGDGASTYHAAVFSVPEADITGASAILEFQGFSPSGQNWHLADVSVVATSVVVPEPPSRLITAAGLLGLVVIRRFWKKPPLASAAAWSGAGLRRSGVAPPSRARAGAALPLGHAISERCGAQ